MVLILRFLVLVLSNEDKRQLLVSLLKFSTVSYSIGIQSFPPPHILCMIYGFQL